MTKKQYQTKYADVKRRLHACGGSYDSQEYRSLKALMNYYYSKGFCT